MKLYEEHMLHCPKCEDTKIWGPNYRKKTIFLIEHLDWECQRCGYKELTHCKDAGMQLASNPGYLADYHEREIWAQCLVCQDLVWKMIAVLTPDGHYCSQCWKRRKPLGDVK